MSHLDSNQVHGFIPELIDMDIYAIKTGRRRKTTSRVLVETLVAPVGGDSTQLEVLAAWTGEQAGEVAIKRNE